MKYLIYRTFRTEEGKVGALELIGAQPTHQKAVEEVLTLKNTVKVFSESETGQFMSQILGKYAHKPEDCLYLLVEVSDYTIMS